MNGILNDGCPMVLMSQETYTNPNYMKRSTIGVQRLDCASVLLWPLLECIFNFHVYTLRSSGKIKRRTARRIIEILKIELLVVSTLASVFYFFKEKVDQFDHSLAIPIWKLEKYDNRCSTIKWRHSNIQWLKVESAASFWMIRIINDWNFQASLRIHSKVFLVCVIPEQKLEGEIGSRWLYHLSLVAVLDPKAGVTWFPPSPPA